MACEIDRPIYISDQENMVNLMQQNIELNRLESRVKGIVLNWQVLLDRISTGTY